MQVVADFDDPDDDCDSTCSDGGSSDDDDVLHVSDLFPNLRQWTPISNPD